MDKKIYKKHVQSTHAYAYTMGIWEAIRSRFTILFSEQLSVRYYVSLCVSVSLSTDIVKYDSRTQKMKRENKATTIDGEQRKTERE